MIIDVHTHLGEHPGHITDDFLGSLEEGINRIYHNEPPRGVRPTVSQDEHHAAMAHVDKCFALGMQSPTFGWSVPNDYVAEYQRKYPDAVVGFCSVDPNRPDALDELYRCRYDLGLRGIKLGPVYQGFDPTEDAAWRVYDFAEKNGMAIVIHQGATYINTAPLRIGMPIFLDEIGLRHPDLTMIIAHMGHPWYLDTIALLRQRPNFYADVSAMYYRPTQFFNALSAAYEYNVTEKLLFGSDYPSVSPLATMEALRSVNRVAEGTNFTQIPLETIEKIINENATDRLSFLWE